MADYLVIAIYDPGNGMRPDGISGEFSAVDRADAVRQMHAIYPSIRIVEVEEV